MSHGHDWMREFPGSIIVSDAAGIILEMNDRAVASFAEQGGAALIGTNLLDCHPEPSRSKLADLLAAPRPNVYTTEKRGVRRLVYQTPWYQDGQYAGLVELVLEIPAAMPHFVREG
jgi:hypothetical protein